MADQFNAALGEKFPIDLLCVAVLDDARAAWATGISDEDNEAVQLARAAIIGHVRACPACKLRMQGHQGCN